MKAGRSAPVFIGSAAADGRGPSAKPLDWGAGWQVDLDLGFNLDDAGGGFDQTESQRVELGDAPS